MLRLNQIDELASLLLRVTELVRQQDHDRVLFVHGVASWLESLEAFLLSCRLPESASIAVCRSIMLSAEEGNVPSGVELPGRTSRSRIRSASASIALKRATEVASAIIAANEQRLAEAERIASQVVALAYARGVVPDREQRLNNTQYLVALRGALASQEDLAVAIVHIGGLLGPSDTLVALDRALTRYASDEASLTAAAGGTAVTVHR